MIPKEPTVVAATGTGYQGAMPTNNAKANGGLELPRSAPKDQEKLSITLSKAGTAGRQSARQHPLDQARPQDGPQPRQRRIAPAPL